ncbi:MAG: hypothetical protein A2189_04150 [Paenibacillus sp. RIFOXYA1_FULL_44_5]|nr:MAG: hypothetical protein A2189_04150 [Paenibacillus sp. RIFOXYA1_FULL_44_5]
MLFSSILVAYDGSQIADIALQKALELAKLDSSIQIDLIHVYKFPVYALGEVVWTNSASMNDSIYQHAEQVVKMVEDKLTELPNPHHVELREGDPAKEIIRYARERSSDLIIIGNRGHNALEEIMLGSVSHNVVQHSPMPVLVIR